MQNSLGLSAVETGIRFLPLTGAIFVSAGIAGRLTSVVPRRVLIAAGFALSGAGLLLMRGLTPSSDWTHLLAGMIVSGIGGGLVSTPLVSTAVGVVEPAPAPEWPPASIRLCVRWASRPASPGSGRFSPPRHAGPCSTD
jgi:hypothetical protein